MDHANKRISEALCYVLGEDSVEFEPSTRLADLLTDSLDVASFCHRLGTDTDVLDIDSSAITFREVAEKLCAQAAA